MFVKRIIEAVLEGQYRNLFEIRADPSQCDQMLELKVLQLFLKVVQNVATAGFT